jgi:hypothetical protein
MAGSLTIDTLKAGSGVLATQNGMTGIAKAWVNFNGSGTAAIRTSFNISSVTRVSTGIYTVNFTTAMPNANYCYQICGRDESNGMGVPTVQADPDRNVTTTALPIIANYPLNQVYYDMDTITVTVFST